MNSSSAVAPNPLPSANFGPLSVSSVTSSRYYTRPQMEEKEAADEYRPVQKTSERDERAFFRPEGKRGVLRLILLFRSCEVDRSSLCFFPRFFSPCW